MPSPSSLGQSYIIKMRYTDNPCKNVFFSPIPFFLPLSDYIFLFPEICLRSVHRSSRLIYLFHFGIWQQRKYCSAHRYRQEGRALFHYITTVRPMYKYMVTEILLCDLGSLVSERHLLFPKARTPTTSRFIYATQVFEGQGVSERTSKHDHMKRVLRSNTRLQYDHVSQNIGPVT